MRPARLRLCQISVAHVPVGKLCSVIRSSEGPFSSEAAFVPLAQVAGDQQLLAYGWTAAGRTPKSVDES